MFDERFEFVVPGDCEKSEKSFQDTLVGQAHRSLPQKLTVSNITALTAKNV